MNHETLQRQIKEWWGIDVPLADVEKAFADLSEYQPLRFETLRGKYKVTKNAYVLLAVENTVMHNGAWVRYIDDLKANYETIVVQSVINRRLLAWFLRNGFERTKKHKDWVIWRSQS